MSQILTKKPPRKNRPRDGYFSSAIKTVPGTVFSPRMVLSLRFPAGFFDETFYAGAGMPLLMNGICLIEAEIATAALEGAGSDCFGDRCLILRLGSAAQCWGEMPGSMDPFTD
jgi:hypothetical protein